MFANMDQFQMFKIIIVWLFVQIKKEYVKEWHTWYIKMHFDFFYLYGAHHIAYPFIDYWLLLTNCLYIVTLTAIFYLRKKP